MEEVSETRDGAELPPPPGVVLWVAVTLVFFVFLAGGALLQVWAGGWHPRAPLGLFLLACAGGAALSAAVPFGLLRFRRRSRSRRGDG